MLIRFINLGDSVPASWTGTDDQADRLDLLDQVHQGPAYPAQCAEHAGVKDIGCLIGLYHSKFLQFQIFLIHLWDADKRG